CARNRFMGVRVLAYW
nr:immunoglobulin heavy chain junction region [Macaca mulatta]MOX61967.1 immunoglobulin heavy chain junction region [Macaca mulatta]MOX64827.1 immunoglobulin heavy chain junction region [Macaca mulatta]MOX65041.1 immunoglobulin heavy chain junction region [Macaca mulatta]MOX65486.1 immunoglobulin heavy chain junction region [Macaca mulatta]